MGRKIQGSTFAESDVRERQLNVDAGNAAIKWVDGHGQYGHFRHALALLSEPQWRQVCGNAELPPEGFMQVGSDGVEVYVAYGDKALRYHTLTTHGAGRYERDYVGLLLCAANVEAFKRGTQNERLRIMHAPGDLQYVDDLLNAVGGEWHIVSHAGKMNIQVAEALPLDEPLGGLYRLAYDDEGNENDTVLVNQTLLVIDVGGHTVDVCAVDAGFAVDYSSLRSTKLGTIEMMDSFERELRHKYGAEFKTVNRADARRMEQGLLNGAYPYGNHKLDCREIAQQNIALLTEEVAQIVQGLGGAANFDTLVLTGGGAALIGRALRQRLNGMSYVPAVKDRDMMRFANVMGMRAFFKALENMGEI